MSTTLRFGLPTPADNDQVVVRARPANPAVPIAGEALDTFPFAIGVTSTALTATVRDVYGTGNTTFTTLTDQGVKYLLFHPDSGLIPNGVTEVALWNSGYDSYEATGEWARKIHEQSNGRIRVIAGLERDLDGSTWYGKATVPADTDTPLAAALTPALNYYATIPGVIAYVTKDDLNNTTLDRDLNTPAIRKIQELDIANRPATASYLGNGSNTIAGLGSDAKIALVGGGGYPSRWISTGVKRAEGDFTHPNDGSTDWWQWARSFVTTYPNTHIWHWAQAHQLGTGSNANADLSYPTAAEIRKQTWELVGAGVKGILWFIWDNEPAGPWDGVAHPNSRTRMAAIGEMSQRLTPGIRARLLASMPTATNNEFTTSGGGSADWLYQDYANAFIGTLYDSVRDEYLVVVCNRATTTQTVTINSATLEGTLVNLENGSQITVGGSVSLGPLDGTIFRFRPGTIDFGVPNITLTSHSMTEEEYWAQHWANPASSNYIAYGDIPLHSNTVIVETTDDLQAVVDAAPDNTTFRLRPGLHDTWLTLLERNGMHFVSDDPNNRATIRNVEIYSYPLPVGLELDQANYTPTSRQNGYQSWVGAIIGTARDGNFTVPPDDLDAVAAFLNPCRDFIFRDIDFRGDPALTTDQYTVPGQGHPFDPIRNPTYHVGVKDVLYEGCTFAGYNHSDQQGAWPGTTALTFHAGMFYATGGVEGFVIRNCTVDPRSTTGGTNRWPCAVYFDGPMGCVLYDNDFSAGGYAMAGFFTLTNWDVRNDWNKNGDGMEFREFRQPKYVAIVKNKLPVARMAWSGRNMRNALLAENTWNYSGLRHCCVEWECEGTYATNLTIRDNTFNGGQIGDTSGTGFVEVKYSSASASNLTITNNTLTGGYKVKNAWVTAVAGNGLPSNITIAGNSPPDTV